MLEVQLLKANSNKSELMLRAEVNTEKSEVNILRLRLEEAEAQSECLESRFDVTQAAIAFQSAEA
eukprot:7604237-Karenia_brevis.AAC.1